MHGTCICFRRGPFAFTAANLLLPWRFCFCRGAFAFAAALLLLPWRFCFCRGAFAFAVANLLLPRRFCFCRDSCGPPYILAPNPQFPGAAFGRHCRQVHWHETCGFFSLHWLVYVEQSLSWIKLIRRGTKTMPGVLQTQVRHSPTDLIDTTGLDSIESWEVCLSSNDYQSIILGHPFKTKTL